MCRIMEEDDDIDDYDEQAIMLLLMEGKCRLRDSSNTPKLKGFLDEVVPRCTYRHVNLIFGLILQLLMN